ncbi:hypothetical protein ACFE04_009768 [Oxalis oulophora]
MAEPRNGTLILCALPRQSYRGDMKNPWMKNPEILCKKVHLMEAIVDPLDLELNQLCDVIVEQLRDRIVTSLLQASLDGFVRVILDGGPSRVFFSSDARLLEEDLEVLKEFFISGGKLYKAPGY